MFQSLRCILKECVNAAACALTRERQVMKDILRPPRWLACCSACAEGASREAAMIYCVAAITDFKDAATSWSLCHVKLQARIFRCRCGSVIRCHVFEFHLLSQSLEDNRRKTCFVYFLWSMQSCGVKGGRELETESKTKGYFSITPWAEVKWLIRTKNIVSGPLFICQVNSFRDSSINKKCMLSPLTGADYYHQCPSTSLKDPHIDTSFHLSLISSLSFPALISQASPNSGNMFTFSSLLVCSRSLDSLNSISLPSLMTFVSPLNRFSLYKGICHFNTNRVCFRRLLYYLLSFFFFFFFSERTVSIELTLRLCLPFFQPTKGNFKYLYGWGLKGSCTA